MSNDEYVEDWEQQRNNLEMYFWDRYIPIAHVLSGIGSDYFNRFVDALIAMDKILEQTLSAAREGDFNLVIQYGTEAITQRDVLYGILMESTGSFEREERGGEEEEAEEDYRRNAFLIPTEPTMPNIRQGVMRILGNYVTEEYGTRTAECERILEGRIT